LIDTGKPRVRWVFSSSANRPFGMVRLSADTDPVGTWAAGYRYFSPQIQCFSHVHAWQLSGVPVMPVDRAVSVPTRIGEIGSDFSHDRETARPGYYAVFLETHGIDAELTATERVGLHRYRFPDRARCSIVLDLGSELGPSAMSDAEIRRVSSNGLEGMVENAPTPRRPKPCRVYFSLRFDRPIDSIFAWRDGLACDPARPVGGRDCGAAIGFAATGGITVRMKVGLSYVSASQARLNLETEVPHWDFDRVRLEAEEDWNRWLCRIQVEGGSERQRTKFHTDLWRALQGGYLCSDVDGRYCDRTGGTPTIRRVPTDRTGRPAYRRLEADIFWGAHWSLSLLWNLAWPDVVHDWCRTLVDTYRHGGLIPRGPSGGNYTFVMIASHSTAFLVAAWMKGVRDFDIETAYAGMRKNAFPGGLMSKAGYEHETCRGGGIEYYLDRGYIPEGRGIEGPIHVAGAAQTLEYAYDDWCLAQLAGLLGKDDDRQRFLDRARNYRNLFNPKSGFLQPRNLDGSWLDPFSPYSMQGWCEANGWQYSFYVPHDIAGLIGLVGGREAFARRLDQAFKQAATVDFYASKPELRRDAVTVNYGNEPGRFTAHLFNHSGFPWLAQKWSRRVLDQTFGSIEPLGFCEDDDNGLAAATSALLAIGLFDLRGGAALKPVYELGSPVFDRITIHVDPMVHPKRTFVIETRGNAPESPFIQSARLNGEELERPWFFHKTLAAGGRLTLELGPTPNRSWGSRPEDAPPSMSTDAHDN
jgi:predicted alpha-1,2-mannosidase